MPPKTWPLFCKLQTTVKFSLTFVLACSLISSAYVSDEEPPACQAARVGRTIRWIYGKKVLQEELDKATKDGRQCTVLSLQPSTKYTLSKKTLFTHSIVLEAPNASVVIRCDEGPNRDVSYGDTINQSFLAVEGNRRLVPYVAFRGGITFSGCTAPFLIKNARIVNIDEVTFR